MIKEGIILKKTNRQSILLNNKGVIDMKKAINKKKK
jgi:hypothetical protein